MLNQLVMGTCAATLSISYGALANEEVADVFCDHQPVTWPQDQNAFRVVSVDVPGPVIEVGAPAEAAKWFPDASERKVFRRALLRSSKVVHSGRIQG
ncbi:hypothetical protein BTO32_11590 [Marinobacter lutaoensis]|uniref:Uncharacterized protein n=1 Tax=Marinobacter lutaoensis TaxID=135739 RepID=A0A1V2DRM0_9GAMM|nr:hypothetical protein BTO32_11590 [Marinobacter lutaoensis]